jgi:tRNA-specific 2-thiouridylase
MSRVVIAMSGGVDSSVAAALLVEEGHEVVGIHMKLHDANPEVAGRCCGTDDAIDARRVANDLGIPFHVMDLREAFQKAVIDEFVATYEKGATPIPCVQCNGVLKFRVLLQRALALGASHLATGHYAQIGEGPTLKQAADTHKDQTYFLFPVTQQALGKTLFPLGGMTKEDVRAHAERLGLATANKPESQEICFVEDGKHAGFVQRARPEVDGSGEIVDSSGRVLGHHDAYWRFTIGQRRGLGVAMGHPVYVTDIDPETGRVEVAGGDDLWHTGLVASRWVWNDRPAPDEVIWARIRHKGTMTQATVGPGEAPEVRFAEPVWAVAPGQAVVVYRGDVVLGGGWIVQALKDEA